MSFFPNALENLIDQFAALPGVGRKSAQRLAFHVLSLPEEEALKFAAAIVDAKKNIHCCSICQNLTDQETCTICASPKRDQSTICVVAQPRDVLSFERSREYNGVYHVLHGVLSPMNHIGPDDIRIQELVKRVAAGGITEVIMATNPDTEGEATAMYIARLLKPFDVKITRLAYGIPVGSNLEYADDATLLRARLGFLGILWLSAAAGNAFRTYFSKNQPASGGAVCPKANVKEIRMASKLKIIPLGGLGEIGKNLTVYEYGKDMFLVDCGMGFPDQDLYGVDMVIPDISYLKANKNRIRGMVITHGHEDHIGAIPYVLKQLDMPIYATPLTAAIIELKLEEHDLLYHTQIFTKKPGDKFKLGCFEVEFIHTNHSIADSVALAIKTPIGTVIHTGDFKIDLTPIQGGMIDLPRLGQLGNEGVLALLSDSTNVERPGYCASEARVIDCFDELFKDCNKRIIVTTFASNVHRLQQIINVAAKYKRKVGITGRSMENIMRVATELGYVDIPDGVMMDMSQIGSLPRSKTVIVCTGSQGEPMSALHRMAFSEHKQVTIDAGDRIIISASAIPGNEITISRVIDELFQKGAEVIYDRNTPLHVSGHACQEELKMMLALTKPRYFIPVHGEYRMLCKHAEIGKLMGVEPKNVLVAKNGEVIEITKRSMRATSNVPAGDVYIDGTGIGDVGSAVLRDRRHLAEDGIVMAIITLSSENGKPVADPEIITRGFVYVKEAEALMGELKRVVNESLASCERQKQHDWATIKGRVKSNISGYLYKTTRRSPMVLPVIIEV